MALWQGNATRFGSNGFFAVPAGGALERAILACLPTLCGVAEATRRQKLLGRVEPGAG